MLQSIIQREDCWDCFPRNTNSAKYRHVYLPGFLALQQALDRLWHVRTHRSSPSQAHHSLPAHTAGRTPGPEPRHEVRRAGTHRICRASSTAGEIRAGRVQNRLGSGSSSLKVKLIDQMTTRRNNMRVSHQFRVSWKGRAHSVRTEFVFALRHAVFFCFFFPSANEALSPAKRSTAIASRDPPLGQMRLPDIPKNTSLEKRGTRYSHFHISQRRAARRTSCERLVSRRGRLLEAGASKWSR